MEEAIVSNNTHVKRLKTLSTFEYAEFDDVVIL